MILTVHGGGATRHARTSVEKAELVRVAVEEQRFAIPEVGAGDNLVFMFAERPWNEGAGWWADNHLHVSVNTATGYGGLVWWVSPARAAAAGDAVSQSCWVSDNPEPPGLDPMVLSDPGGPVRFDRRSTLPLQRIRAALEEFCLAGTGDRPQIAQWVRGEISGERLE